MFAVWLSAHNASVTLVLYSWSLWAFEGQVSSVLPIPVKSVSIFLFTSFDGDGDYIELFLLLLLSAIEFSPSWPSQKMKCL